MENQQPTGEAQNSQKKEWYKNWWGVIIVIAFLPIVAIWYIWAKTKWGKTLKITLTVVVVFFTLVAVANNSSNTDNNQTSSQPQQNVSIPTQETKSEIPIEPAKELTTVDKLWNALDKSMKTRTDYNVAYDENKKEAIITFSPKDFWDENSVVKDSYSTLVKYGKEAFQIEGVNSLTVDHKLDFTDRYGKKSTNDAVIITMSKIEFDKFDWENLKYQPVYNRIKASASKYYVDPGIESKLDYSKLYLAL